MRARGSEIQINAPPRRVWRALTDFDAYPEWNPFIRSIQGDPEVGSRLSARIEPPGARGMTLRPTVRALEPGRELRWLGHLLIPGLADAEHRLLRDLLDRVGHLFDRGHGLTHARRELADERRQPVQPALLAAQIHHADQRHGAKGGLARPAAGIRDRPPVLGRGAARRARRRRLRRLRGRHRERPLHDRFRRHAQALMRTLRTPGRCACRRDRGAPWNSRRGRPRVGVLATTTTN